MTGKTAAELAALAAVNAGRAAAAGRDAARVCAAALPHLAGRDADLARARIGAPTAPWGVVAAQVGMSKDTAIGRYRRRIVPRGRGRRRPL